jgi:YHS domain-containing protein
MNKTLASAVSAIALSAAVLGTGIPSAFAVNEINTAPGLTTAGAPLALHGFDPVAYFSAGQPAQGDARHVATHNGAAYYFASKANLDAFEADPAKYAPQFGGYCAYGVSVGKKFDGDPRFWRIVDGRLYVNLNAEIAEKFNADTKGALKKAEASWPKIEDKAPSAL